MTEVSDTSKGLQSRVLYTEHVHWRSFRFIQQDQFKDIAPESFERLKASIIQNQFTQPFYAWRDPEGGTYCLDGKHRTMALEALEKDGHKVPELLPATFIECQDIHEAARLVLIYSSIYAKISQQGLFDFLSEYELQFDEVIQSIDLPDFSEGRFIQSFDVFGPVQEEEPVEIPEDDEVIVAPGDLFQIGDHRIYCGSFTDQAGVATLMDGVKARILICDPPYNLPADFFLKDNKKKRNHKNFAMAAGEMSDEEFSRFLESIMKAGMANTVPGAIHYIFMDHRHGWHMCDAAGRAYGSVIPKQVCTWVKDIMANGSFYRAQQELCFVFADGRAKALWNRDLIDEGGFYKPENELCYIFKNGDGARHLSHVDLKDRIRTNVWRYPSANSTANPDRYELKNHPTPKPVAMIADAILDTTNTGEAVIDWFLGSGTTLIAAEQTGRHCYATEIEPKYVQADIVRYIRYCEKSERKVSFTHLNGKLTLNDFEQCLHPKKN